MVGMAVLNVTTITRWRALVADPALVEPHLRVLPTAGESALLEAAADGLVSVLTSTSGLAPLPADSSPPELVAFLAGLATGVQQARQANGAPAGEAGALEMVTGLLAAGHALREQAEGLGRVLERAGMAATDGLVAGSGLHEVLSTAAATFAASWYLSAEPWRRSFCLIAQVLAAFSAATGPHRTGPAAAGCGARPGEHRGERFPAEITFTVLAPRPQAESLQQDLRSVAREVTVWSTGERHQFHVHSDDAGEVVSAAYASATLFDLRIGLRDGIDDDLPEE